MDKDIKTWYIFLIEYHSYILKKKKIRPFAAKWIDLEIATVSKVSQTEKDKYHMILLTCRI